MIPGAQFLLVHREAEEFRVIAQSLRSKAGGEVAAAVTGAEGARLITGQRFDLALIDTVLPDMAATDLAALAANQNTPVLLLSENSYSSEQVRRSGYCYLEKPFDVNALVLESIALVNKSRRIDGAAAESGEAMEARIRALTTEITEANRLFDFIMRRLGRKKTD